jgi:hypothetical protein
MPGDVLEDLELLLLLGFSCPRLRAHLRHIAIVV